MAIRVFANYGFPIIKPISIIKNQPTSVVAKAAEDKQITYEDLVCVISIFAQDIKFRSQNGK